MRGEIRGFLGRRLPKRAFFGYDRKDGKKTMILKYGIVILGLAGMLAVLPLGNQSCAAGVGGAGGAGGAAGSGIAPQTCDTEVWKTMEMRAKMETEREIMQNQNLIFKPDSILAYTCFDKFAEHAAKYGGVIFTHTTYWDGKEIIPWGPPDGMDHSMKQVVLKSMDTYMQKNFPYSMLGGRGDDIGGTGMNAYTTSLKGKGDYSCDRMNNVWKVAKCLNFVHNDKFQDTDGFYPYMDLKGHDGGDDIMGYATIKDTRAYPTELKCESNAPVAKNSWQFAWLKSRNENSFGNMNRFYEFSNPLRKTFEDVRKRLEPNDCEALPIFTGVTVILSNASGGDEYPDGVCTNPGCVYVKSGSGGICKRAN